MPTQMGGGAADARWSDAMQVKPIMTEQAVIRALHFAFQPSLPLVRISTSSNKWSRLKATSLLSRNNSWTDVKRELRGLRPSDICT